MALQILSGSLALALLIPMGRLYFRSTSAGLAALLDAEFLYRREFAGDQRFQFKHALVHDMAYQSLLKSTRQAHHKTIARVLEQEFVERCESDPQLLARHHQESGPSGWSRAVMYWLRAGQQAVARSANAEAIGHLEAGLALLGRLPAADQGKRQELRMQLALGTAYLVSRGYRAPEVGKAYRRAQALGEELGDAPELVAALFGMWRHTMAPPDFATGLELGNRLIVLAERGDDAASLVLAHYALGSVRHLLGDAVRTREHMEKAVRHYDPVEHRSLLLQAGIDPGVTCHSVLSHALWELGSPDQALAQLPDFTVVQRSI